MRMRGLWLALLALGWGAKAALAAEPVPPLEALAKAWAPAEAHWVRLTIAAPGRDAEHTEHTVAQPIERALTAVTGLKSMVALSADDGVRWALRVEGDAFEARHRVAEAARGAAKSLPPTVDLPLISAGGGAPLLRFALRDPRASAAQLAAPMEALKAAIERLPGVTRVALCGVDAGRIEVNVDSSRLPPEVGGAAGIARRLSVHPAAEVEALGETLLAPNLRLRDVATIERAARPRCQCTADGGPSACLSVWAVEAARAAVLAEVARSGPPPPSRAPEGAWVQVWGGLGGVDAGNALQIALLRAAPAAWLWRWPDRFELWVPGEAAASVQVALDAVPGVRRTGGRSLDAEAWVAWISGAADRVQLQATAETVAAALRAQGAIDALNLGVPGPPSLEIVPDRVRLAALGLSVAELAHTVRAAQEGLEVRPEVGLEPGRAWVGARQAPPIWVYVNRSDSKENFASSVMLAGPAGLVPLSAVATVTSREGARPGWRRNGRRSVPVRAVGLTRPAIEAALRQVALPAGLVVEVDADDDLGQLRGE